LLLWDPPENIGEETNMRIKKRPENGNETGPGKILIPKKKIRRDGLTQRPTLSNLEESSAGSNTLHTTYWD